MRKYLPLFFLLFIPCFLFGQEINWEKVRRFSSDSIGAKMMNQSVYPYWIEGTGYFHYRLKTDSGVSYWLVNRKTGKKTLFVNNVEFSRQYNKITGDSLDAANLKLYGIDFLKNDLNQFYWKKGGRTFLYNIHQHKLREVAEKDARTYGTKLSTFYDSVTKDSLYTMLGGNFNLFIRNNYTEAIEQLTFDGTAEASYTRRSSKEPVENNSMGFWVKGSHRYILLSVDDENVKNMALIHSLGKKRPTHEIYKMPMPGDKEVKQYRLWWYNADTDVGKLLAIDKYPDQEVKLSYFRSDSILYFTRKSRASDQIELCKLDLANGAVREVISEKCLPHINLSLFNYRVINNGENIIWWSERTGKGNYYLYDSHGNLLNRITQGDLVAGRIVEIDSLSQSFIFEAYGGVSGVNPSYRYYYKVDFSGRSQRLLTPGNGTHELMISADKHYAIDNCSRMDRAPECSIVSLVEDKKPILFERMNDQCLRNIGWKPPVVLKVKAADQQTDLWGVMYLPSDIDTTKKYPIISNVYPGPQSDQIPLSFTPGDNENQALAEMGFVVINVGPRGSSPLRGHDFYCFGHHNLRDYPLADDKYVIEELAKKYSFIDLKRVGIYGHSGGGFQTVMALLTYPDFYKVGVASSGNYDNNIYIRWWGETFQGLNEEVDSVSGEVTFSCKIPTAMELAGNLKGKLLLITGEVDKNVHPSTTIRMANALIENNKRFEMFVVPGAGHGLMSPYYYNLIRYYFAENLLSLSRRDIDIVNHN